MHAHRSRAVSAIASFALALVACATTEPPPFRRIDSLGGKSAPVAEHARLGAAARDALERADVPAAHRAAHDLIALVLESERPAPRSRLAEMIQAARQVEASSTLEEATRAFADLSYRCGVCHAEIGGPRSFPALAPPDGQTPASRMRRHQWASSRLWEGLVAPSDEAWKSGAEVLADAPFDVDGAAAPEVQALALSTQELGAKATTATRSSARIGAYAQILSTCAACHRQGAGRGPTP